MSSAVVSTSAALGRPFLFDTESEPEVCSIPGAKKPTSTESAITQIVQSKIKNQKSKILHVTPASRLEIRPTPEMVTSGIPALDALTGGLPRGCLTEICGSASSGRTTVLLAALAAATRRGEYCAVIDASDALDPQSLAAVGIDLDHLLWVRCNENSLQRHGDTEKAIPKKIITNNTIDPGMIGKGASEKCCREPDLKGHAFSRAAKSHKINPALAAEGLPFWQNFDETSHTRNQSEQRLEQVLRATDLLLESGGFGLIILDLADLPPQAARRIPLTTWFRFRRAVEHKPTILLSIEQQPIAGSCSSLLLQLGTPYDSKTIGLNQEKKNFGNAAPSHAHLLTALEIHAELIRSRLDRKPVRSIAFETKTVWAG